MKKHSLFLFLFVSFSFSLSGQTMSVKELRKAAKNKSDHIVSGKIDFLMEERCRDSTHYQFFKSGTMIFYNEKRERQSSSLKAMFAKLSHINIFLHEDSLQYLINGNDLVTIDHKKKMITYDTLLMGRKHMELMEPDLLPYALSFYYNNNFTYPWNRGTAEEKVIETDSSYLFILECARFAALIQHPKYQKKHDRKAAKVARNPGKFSGGLFLALNPDATLLNLNTCEIRKKDSLLIFFSSAIKDKDSYAGDAIIEDRTRIIATDMDNEKYHSLSYYTPHTYSDTGYKIIRTPSYDDARQEVIKARLDSMKYTCAPVFVLPDVLTGDTIALEAYKGKWVLLNFFFMRSCSYMKLIPEIYDIQEKYKTKDLQVLGIAIDKNNETSIDFVRQKKFPYPIVSAAGTGLISSYKVSSYPTVILIAPDSTIAFIGTGTGCGKALRTFLKKNVK